MGSCYSHRRASYASEIDIPFPTVGKNRPLKKKLPKWTLEEGGPYGDDCGVGRSGGGPRCSRSGRELERMRDEFWDTAPAFEGRKEIWDALRVAATALLVDNDFALAQAILDGANITLPRGSLTECYDELGARYKIPAYCIAPPSNLLILKQQQQQHHKANTKNGGHLGFGDKDGCGAGHLTSSSCLEDEPTTTNVEDELDELELHHYHTENLFAVKSRPWNTQDALTPGSACSGLEPAARSSSGTSSSSSRQSQNSSRPKRGATPMVDTSHGRQSPRQGTTSRSSTLGRLASLLLGRHHQKVTSLAIGTTRHNSKNGTPSSLAAPPPQTVIKLKLRLGTCGTDYELSCALRDTVLATKRRLAKKVLFERLRCLEAGGIADQQDPPANPEVVVEALGNVEGGTETTTPVKKHEALITKREINGLVAAQRWLLSGKIIPDKITIQQAKIPPGFVIQVALCGPTPSHPDPPCSTLDVPR